MGHSVSDSALLVHDRARGVRLIAGVDEVGRACLAGPIMAAGVLFDLERLASGAGRDLLEELDDSKRLARPKRERLAQAILAHAEAVSLVSIPASQIDRIGIDPANVACLERALRVLGERAELRLVDGRLALGPSPAHRLSFNARCFAEAGVAAPARRQKPRRASWRELPAAEMAAHLLETPTIGDRVWTDEPRRPRETRTAFIRRVLLGETAPVETPEGETAATETTSAFAAGSGNR